MRFYAGIIFSFLVATAAAQNPFQVYEKWRVGNPYVRPYLFFNQPQYAPGDTVWLKAYMFENGTLQKGSFLLNVTVVNDQAKVVARTSVRLKEGRSGAQLLLPDTLKSGIYRFYAHNLWMNGNPTSLPTWKDIVVTGRYSVVPSQLPDPSPKFFPEGGTLINGISNRVVVMMNHSNDSCKVQATGGEVVASFRMVDGIGSFLLTPQKGKTYSITAGQNRFAVPSAADDGIGVLLTRRGDNSIQVMISAPEESVYRKNPLFVLVTINGVAYFSQKLNFGNPELTQFDIPLNTLPAGIARLAVISNTQHVLAERNFLVDYERPPQLKFKTRQDTIKSRGRVDIEVQLMDQSGQPLEGEFAVSVIDQKLFAMDAAPDFAGELLSRAKTDFRINRAKADWTEYNDQLLIATPVDTAHWNEVFSSEPTDRPTGRYSRFLFKVTDKATGEPLPDYTRMLVYLQSNANNYDGLVLDGTLDLVVPGDFWDVDDFYFLAESHNGYKYDINVTLQEEKLGFSPPSHSRLTGDADVYADFISKVKMIDRSYNFFTAKAGVAKAVSNPNHAIEDELNGADISVDLRNFISFPNMDEVLREIIPGLVHRKLGSKSIVRVDLINTDLVPKADPLYVIDGLMTMNSDYFMNLKPEDVMTIKVIRDFSKLARLGGVGRNGVVIVQTRKPDPEAVKSSGAYVTVQGISTTTPFKVTSYTADASSMAPDFRSTLYWNPSIRTTKDGKALITFWASDDVGQMTINIVGTTTRAIPFSGQTKVEVSFNDRKK
jgi:hypothetical protein